VGEKKRIIYYYDGEINKDDTQIDPEGSLVLPKKDEIIRKHGQNWRVTFVGPGTADPGDEYSVFKVYVARA
jgi:hypothetical protein